MSAEAFGESLLGEVKKESLDELLYEFNRAYAHREPPGLGIEPIDELLRIFTGKHVHARGELPEGTAIDQGKRRREGLNKETVLEITSPSSGCGKSHLLYYIAAIAILPASFNDIPLDGADSAVVFLDTDGRFDVRRLQEVMVDIVRQKYQQSPEPIECSSDGTIMGEQLQAMIHHCLHHVHLLRPQSSESLLSTLNTLEEYLLHSLEHFSAKRPLHSVLLDSANAFYWQDRFQEDVARISSSFTTNQPNKRTSSQAIKRSLRHLQKVFSCAIIYTTWGLVPHSRHQAGVLSFPPWWSDFPTLQIVVDRDSIRPFASDMTIEEAIRDAPARHSFVLKGKFSGWVNPWGRNEWASDIPELLSRTEGKGSFSFWITRNGVVFDQKLINEY